MCGLFKFAPKRRGSSRGRPVIIEGGRLQSFSERSGIRCGDRAAGNAGKNTGRFASLRLLEGALVFTGAPF